MSKPGTAALESLSAVERASILGALLRAHPELLAEAEPLAAGFLSQEDPELGGTRAAPRLDAGACISDVGSRQGLPRCPCERFWS
jgi:hypothetical protein